ncbi:MAG TPA: hypothetical protein VMU99_09605 [Acidimicrobiales bacterium]|nr:hypothetical protein [Acidimicrobiales bacterium]
MSRRPALAVVDAAALIARVHAGDWRAVDDLIGAVVASDYAPDVIEILTRLAGVSWLSDCGLFSASEKSFQIIA